RAACRNALSVASLRSCRLPVRAPGWDRSFACRFGEAAGAFTTTYLSWLLVTMPRWCVLGRSGAIRSAAMTFGSHGQRSLRHSVGGTRHVILCECSPPAEQSAAACHRNGRRDRPPLG